MSTEDYGSFRYALTIATFFIIPISGIPFAMTRYVGKYISEPELAANYLFNSLVLGLSILISIIFLAYFIFDGSLFLILIITSMAIDAFYIAYANAYLIYSKMCLYKVIANFLQCIFLFFLFLYDEVDLFLVFLIFSFSGVLSIFLLELTHKKTLLISKISYISLVRLFKFSVPATLGAVGWTVMFGVNAIWIKFFYEIESFAYFSAGETFAQIFAIVPTAFASIILPKHSAFKQRSETVKPLYYAIFSTIAVSVFMVIPFIIAPDFIVNITFGSSYQKTTEVLIPLILSIIFISIHTLFAQTMFAFNQTKLPMFSMVSGAMANVFIGYFLTKNYGMLGTSYSLMISCFISLIILFLTYHFYFLKKFNK
tara:strand:+ start:1413 stop:2519 length:1107 start_codon:yes stop_codon:yes gene_type:complete